MCRRFALLLALLAVTSPVRAQPSELRPPAILRGRPTLAGEFTATGALLRRRADGSTSIVCAGTLIAARVVLTAAHCLSAVAVDPHYFVLEGDASDFKVTRAHVHPDYAVHAELDVVFHDIGVVELAASPRATPVAPASSAPPPGTRVAIVGYGSTALPADGARVKNTGTGEVLTVLEHDLIIGGGAGGQANCTGDSGGPAFDVDPAGGGRLIGIVSRAQDSDAPCQGNTVYTRVDVHLDFIDSVSAQRPSDAPPGCSAARTTAPGAAPGLLLLACLLAERLGRRLTRPPARCSPAYAVDSAGRSQFKPWRPPEGGWRN